LLTHRTIDLPLSSLKICRLHASVGHVSFRGSAAGYVWFDFSFRKITM
jgi:hypothetical protein